MKQRFVRAVSVMFLLLAALPLFSCTGSDRRTLRIGAPPTTDVVPLALSRQIGLAQDRGVLLEVLVYPTEAERDQALQAGELDGVYTDLASVCSYRNVGLDLRVVSGTESDWLLLASPGSGITRLERAKGCSAAVAGGAGTDYALDRILAEAGLPPDFVARVRVDDSGGRMERLTKDAVTLALLPEPFAALAQERGAVLLGSARIAGAYPGVLALSEAALERKREAVAGMLAARDEAAAWLGAAAPDEAVRAATEACPFLANSSSILRLPHYLPSAPPGLDRVRDALCWAKQRGLCGPALTPGELLAETVSH